MNKKVSVKKLLAALVVLTMVATAAPAVMAAGSANLTLTSCVVNEGTVTVEFSIDKTNNMEHILVLVTPLGEDVNYENAVALQYKAISAASDTVDVLMPDDLPTGTYVVTVGSPVASDRVSERVSYMSYQERSMIVDNINSDTPDINDLVTAFNRSDVALEAAGINSAYYDALNKDAKREFAQYIVDHKLDGDEDNVVGNGDGRVDMKEIGSVANEAFVVVYASNETLSKNASELGFRDVFGGYEDFRLSDSGGRYRMISDYQGFFSVLRAQDTYSASIDGIKDSLEAALTLERINEAGYLNIADEILNYKRFFGVDTDASGITTEKLNEIIANETLNDFFGKAMRATGSEFSKVRDGEKTRGVRKGLGTLLRGRQETVQRL